MHIGIVGGIGPAATDYYYRKLIEASAASGVALQLTIAHADAPTLLQNLERDDKVSQADIFVRLARRLESAGAQAVAITSIAGHFCIDELKAVSPLTVIDLLQETNTALRDLRLDTVGVIGTRTVMETRLYGAIDSATLVAPREPDLARVHEAYVAMAVSGTVTDAQREVFASASRRLTTDGGAEAIMLGGTDLALVYGGGDSEFEIIDCAKIHIDALARVAAAQSLP